jgi:hypothetical protein
MPAELLKQLAGVLQSEQVEQLTIHRLLANWWRLADNGLM